MQDDSGQRTIFIIYWRVYSFCLIIGRYDLMRRCWSTKKEERTTFTQLKVDLMRIASSNTAKCSEDAYYY